MMRKYVLVFFGGGMRASARSYLSGAVYRVLPSGFPYGNLVVNITGCFAIGLLMILMEERFLSEPSLRVFLTIGMIGGFTPFSSFSFETVALLRDAEILRASLNIALSVFCCLAATTFGMFISRLF